MFDLLPNQINETLEFIYNIQLQGIYPNITIRIILPIIPVSAASAESCCKLKLIKNPPQINFSKLIVISLVYFCEL